MLQYFVRFYVFVMLISIRIICSSAKNKNLKSLSNNKRRLRFSCVKITYYFIKLTITKYGDYSNKMKTCFVILFRLYIKIADSSHQLHLSNPRKYLLIFECKFSNINSPGNFNDERSRYYF